MPDAKNTLLICHDTRLERRHDLDWLRILVFGLLIFYHIGMLYVANWGFHFKSQYLSQPLEGLMLMVNQWRMPLLWVISGISIRFVLQKVSSIRFVKFRSLRLLLPLLFGVLVIVPPQLYVEMTGKGDLNMSYWQFYQVFFDIHHPVFAKYQDGILPHIDVNHLWYLRELWTFSLIILCLSPLLNMRFIQKAVDALANKTGVLGIIVLPLIPLVMLGATFSDDKTAIGFCCLVYGYLIGWNESVWRQIKNHRKTFLAVTVTSYIAIVFAYFTVWLNPVLKAQWWAPWLGIIAELNAWCGVLSLLGYAAVHLNKPGKKLTYLNDAVLPYYILHQTFIIVLAFYLSPMKLGPWLEPLIIIIATFFACIISYEIIRRLNVLRVLFGLKWQDAAANASVKTGMLSGRIRSILAYMLLLPLAFIIIL